MALDSNVAPSINSLARAFLAAGQGDSARFFADRLPRILPWTGIRGYIHGVTGDTLGARQILEEIHRRGPQAWASAMSLAWIYFGLSDTTSGLRELERASRQREIWPNWYTVFDGAYDDVAPVDDRSGGHGGDRVHHDAGAVRRGVFDHGSRDVRDLAPPADRRHRGRAR